MNLAIANNAKPSEVQVAAKSDETVTIGGDEVLLQLQMVDFRGGDKGLVFFDNGSTAVIIREKFAARLKLRGRRCVQWLQVCGKPQEPWETVMYTVTIVDREGDCHSMQAYGMDKITSDIESVNIDGVTHFFPNIPAEDLQRPRGKVNLLCGLNQAALHPTGGGGSRGKSTPSEEQVRFWMAS